MKRLALCLYVLFVLTSYCNADTLLIDQRNPYLSYGYGLSLWDNMTGALNSEFGVGNIMVTSATLDNVANLSSYDALWLTARQPDDVLSAAEQTALSAYIAAGHRVALIGENGNWTSWNNSILALVGGSYSGIDTSATLIPVLVHPLTAGITSWNTIADGIATGGTPLFDKNVATLWQPAQNVVSVLSVNAIDDTCGASAGNLQFENNLSVWLNSGASSVVPEPSSLTLLGLGLACFGSVAWLKKRKTKVVSA